MTTVDERRPATVPGAPAPELTTAQLLLEWDRRRARSQQRELGMSELGGCRRRAGYRLAGTAPTNPGSSLQAVMGTAIHDAVERVFREMQAAGLIPAEDLVEHEVRFAGILGHLDRYDSRTATVHDTKTTSQNWLDHILLHGADKPHIWQVSLYAAALITEGKPVRRMVIDYIARDTGNEHQVELTFDPQHVRDALAWLDNVRSMPVEMLNRDHAPESAFCGHCPFRDLCWEGATPNRDPRSVLYLENPDALEWARELEQARADESAAKKRAEKARAALDALRPNDAGKSDPLDVGHPTRNLVWSVSYPEYVDTDAVKAEYAAAGVRPPMKPPGKPRVELRLVAKPKAGKK